MADMVAAMIKLGNHTFNVPTPGAMRSFALQQRILPVAGRIVAVLFHVLQDDSIKEPGDLLKADVAKVLPVALPHLGSVFAEMPPGELEAITRELLRDATFDKLPLFAGGPGGDAFDAVMGGKTLDTWKLLWHALQVWYPDFFTTARSFAAKGPGQENHSAASSTLDPPGPASASSPKAGRRSTVLSGSRG